MNAALSTSATPFRPHWGSAVFASLIFFPLGLVTLALTGFAQHAVDHQREAAARRFQALATATVYRWFAIAVALILWISWTYLMVIERIVVP